MSDPKSIGIFGGTFDPIHFGHLRAAFEIYQALKLDEMRLIPCRYPPHRGIPIADASHRLHMVSLAIENSCLKLDEQEMKREGPSYTIDTLMSLRREFPYSALYMVIGLDSFLTLSSWYQWEKLIQLANIVVIHRTGWNFPEKGDMMDFFKAHSLKSEDNIHQHEYASGKILTQAITSLDIKASGIRSMIASGQSPEFLLPKNVLKYIQQKSLYSYSKSRIDAEVTE